MRIGKQLWLLLSVLTIGISVKAQEVKHCGLMNAESKLKEKYPEIVTKIKSLDDYLNTLDASKLEKTRGNKLIIPIVFHIIHNYGPENISDAQIFDEVRILNEDYQKRNPDTSAVIPEFQSIVANCNYEFRLATKDPNGNCTNGIDRIASYKTYQADDQSKLNSWNPIYYLNIWVVNSIGANGVAGYAYKPATADVIFYYDGVLILHDYIGSIGTGTPNTSRALTHEIGHCMNLDHTWGPTNDPNMACGDDAVLDTPPTKGHSNCIVLKDSFCNPLVIENVQNYMEYAYCSNMFTKGQNLRMDITLANSVAMRSSLVSNLGHYWTGVNDPMPDCPAKGDFSVNRQFTCPGNNVTLRNQSYNDTISSVSWTFPSDATPASSTSMTTVGVNFSTFGWKDIAITANSNAGSGSTTKSNYIYVTDPIGKVVTGQINSFEDQAENDKWPIFNYSNNYFKWKFYESTKVLSGSKCLEYKAYDNRSFPLNRTLSQRGDIDDIITPAYDLTGLSTGNAYLGFYLASATMGSTIIDMTDTLFVYYSNNCGNSWFKLANYQNATLFDNGSNSSEFFPDGATVWKPVSIALPSGALTNSTFFKLRFAPCDQSNNLYIDDFQISSQPTDIKESSQTGFSFELIPNPATDNATIHILSPNNADAEITITNIVGAKIATLREKITGGDQHTVEMPSSVFISKGIYLVTIEMNNRKITKKIVLR